MAFQTGEVASGARVMHPLQKVLLTVAVIAVVIAMLFMFWAVWDWAYRLYPAFTVKASVTAVIIAILAYMCVPSSKPGEE